MRIRFFLLFLAAFLASAGAAEAGGGTSFAYQGLLLDQTGGSLASPNHSIWFRIYDQPTGGTALWGCTNAVLLDGKGQFSVELSGLGEVFAAHAQDTLYLGLTVDGDIPADAEISPRQKLLSVPHAVWAADGAVARNGLAVDGALQGIHASVGTPSANSLTVANGLSCGSLMSGSMTVTNGNLHVDGVVEGKGVIPLGGIITWSGAVTAIPSGWALCNGQTANGRATPDLRDRFIVGAGGSYGVGETGGEEQHVLTISEMPSHNHSYDFHMFSRSLGVGVSYYKPYQREYWYYERTAYSLNAGGSQPHENRPPYYALCYIMRVK